MIPPSNQSSGKPLSPRQLEVLCLLVAGLTNRQIALSLGVSLKTVENHLEDIYRKLEVQSRVQAAVKALLLNLV